MTIETASNILNQLINDMGTLRKYCTTDSQLEQIIHNYLDNHNFIKHISDMKSEEMLPLALEKIDEFLGSNEFESKIDNCLNGINFDSLVEEAIDERLKDIDIEDSVSGSINELLEDNLRRGNELQNIFKEVLEERFDEIAREVISGYFDDETLVRIFKKIIQTSD